MAGSIKKNSFLKPGLLFIHHRLSIFEVKQFVFG
jgi:hypothetical protein